MGDDVVNHHGHLSSDDEDVVQPSAHAAITESVPSDARDDRRTRENSGSLTDCCG